MPAPPENAGPADVELDDGGLLPAPNLSNALTLSLIATGLASGDEEGDGGMTGRPAAMLRCYDGICGRGVSKWWSLVGREIRVALSLSTKTKATKGGECHASESVSLSSLNQRPQLSGAGQASKVSSRDWRAERASGFDGSKSNLTRPAPMPALPF